MGWRHGGFAVVCAAVLAVAGCGGGKKEDGGAPAAMRVVTSFYPMYIAALNVAKGVPGVEVRSMAGEVTGCLHDYQLTPDDMKTLSGASVFVVNGGGMETFLEKVTSRMPGLKTISASAGIPLLKNAADGEPNPHVWVSLTHAIRQAENIAAGLAAADPAHAALYRKNAAEYGARLAELRERMRTALAGVKNRRIVTFHEAFPYFAAEFGLTIVAVIEREPGSEPGARELAETIETVKKSGVTALFAEPQYPAKSAETVARETGAKVYTLDPCVSGPMDADAYLRVQEANLKVLAEALGGG